MGWCNRNSSYILHFQAPKFKEETSDLRCRFYENQFPEPEEVVMVNVTQIGEMGAYVTLLEYDDIEGMILLSELSRRRIRSINKLVRVNRTEIVMVIRVDKEKGELAVAESALDFPERDCHASWHHCGSLRNFDVCECLQLMFTSSRLAFL